MTRHIFGPVPSRRLGISLGVDIIPYKTCTLDCLYCECGCTSDLSLERRRVVEPQHVLAELAAALRRIPRLDYITFSGSGEPTLNSDLGYLIAEIKKTTSVPVAVLTNGTLLFQAEVRRDLLPADVVLPSLDAATPEAFHKLNQPHPDLVLQKIIAGLIQFRQEYPGNIWLEIFLVEGINTGAEELAALHEAIKKVAPDKVQLNTLDRPPAYPGVRAADLPFLEGVRRLWPDLPVEIIKRVHRREEILAFSQNLENSILNTIRRRPLTIHDLETMTGMRREELFQYLDVLEREKKVRTAISGGNIFYEAADKKMVL